MKPSALCSVVIETSILLNHAGTPRLTRRSLQAVGRHGPGAPPGDLQPAGEESAGGGGGSDRRRGGCHHHHTRPLEGRCNNINNHIQQVGRPLHCISHCLCCRVISNVYFSVMYVSFIQIWIWKKELNVALSSTLLTLTSSSQTSLIVHTINLLAQTSDIYISTFDVQILLCILIK